MKLSELLSKDRIIAELKGEIKEEIINELIELFNNDVGVYDIAEPILLRITLRHLEKRTGVLILIPFIISRNARGSLECIAGI